MTELCFMWYHHDVPWVVCHSVLSLFYDFSVMQFRGNLDYKASQGKTVTKVIR